MDCEVIDLFPSDIIEFLITRRFCERNWRRNLLPLQQTIRDSLIESEDNEFIKQLPKNTNMDYFTCVKLKDAMSAADRSIFGNSIVKKWKKIVERYEDKSLNIVDSANKLIQILKHDIPSLKKEINYIGKYISDMEDTKRSSSKRLHEHQKQLRELCEKYYIENENVSIDELNEMLNKNCIKLNDVIPLVRRLNDSLTYHSQYTSFMNSANTSQQELFPIIRFIIEKKSSKLREMLKEINSEDFLSEDEYYRKDLNDLLSNLSQNDQIDFSTEYDFADIDNNYDEEENGGGSKGIELSIFECQKVRWMFINELYRLKAFFTVRSNEAKKSDQSVILCEMTQNMPKNIEQFKSEEIDNFLSNIQQIFDIFNENEYLFQILSDPKKTFDSIFKQIELHRKHIEKEEKHIENYSNDITKKSEQIEEIEKQIIFIEQQGKGERKRIGKLMSSQLFQNKIEINIMREQEV
ncbi:hypothetical protein SNEBB_005495 [Seison nebaliae]|nr:hypothetical protein SNEBB_005495 [Seison nebaliae]